MSRRTRSFATLLATACLVVVGLSLDVLRSLGGGIDKQGEESGDVEPAPEAVTVP